MSAMILGGRKWFYQWDINQCLMITDHPIGTQVHFSLHEDDESNALVMESYGSAPGILVDVPNSLLQTAGQLHAYIYPINGDEGHTAEHWKFEIREREKPADYIHTEDEVISLGSKLNKNVGAENVGKAMVVDETGEIVPGEVLSSGSDCHITYIENLDTNNPVYLRDLDSGTYMLVGKFRPYNGSTNTFTFSTGMLVSVVKQTSTSYVQIFYSKNNTLQYLEITDTAYTRKDAKLIDMESVSNKTNVVDENSTDSKYPSAKAVYDALDALRTELTALINN